MLQTWKNGEKGEVVRKIIEQNFNTLERRLSDTILALSTERRLLLPSIYSNSDLIVFDTDLEKWFKYNGKTWEPCDFANTGSANASYTKTFSPFDWDSAKKINIPFSEHLITNPTAHLYILYNGVYEPVSGGYNIDSDFNITLSADLAFEGKVVVK